jgi:prephenate dehydrogenase
MPLYQTVAIVGPGLIGASIGLALRERGLAATVLGIGRRQVSLDAALEVGAIDRASLDVADGVADADLVILATPIRAIPALMPALAAALRPDAVLTEVASVKRSVIEMIREHLPPGRTFIPTHPMAGSERSGPRAASADLYEGAVCLFTPFPDTPEAELQRLRALWQALGARVLTLSPEDHDQAVAAVSHVPHLVAAALVAAARDEDLECAGTGFIDFTRIASGDADLWTDICRHNARAVVEATARLIETLVDAVADLVEEDYETFREFLERARERREALLAARGLIPPETP